MGATIYTARKVYAFRATTNTVGYILMEETFEKNVTPHTPRWGALAFGTLEDVMQMVFLGASSVESGMLQGRPRTPSTTAYIKGWLDLLAQPEELVDSNLHYTLRFGSYGASLPSTTWQGADAKQPILDRLQERGYALQSEQLRAGKDLRVQLADDFDMLRAIYGGEHATRLVHPSYLFRSGLMRGLPNPDLGYQAVPRTTRTPCKVPKILFIEEPRNPERNYSNLLVETPTGEYLSRGWAYSVIGDYLRQAWRDELAQPGSYKATLSAWRQAIAAATPVPDSMVLKYSESHLGSEARKWEYDDLRAIANAMGADSTEFSTTWGEVKAREIAEPNWALLHKISRSNAARWILTPGTPARTPDMLDHLEFLGGLFDEEIDPEADTEQEGV